MNNTKSQEHTPKDWRIGDGGWTIFGPPNGKPAPSVIATMEQGASMSPLERKANALLIVKAVNSHDDLIAALQRLFNCVPLSVEGPHQDSKIVTSVAYWRGAFDQAKAALEKAGAQ